MTAAWCNAMQGEYDKAWGYLVEANRLQRDTYSFNPEASSDSRLHMEIANPPNPVSPPVPACFASGHRAALSW